MNVLAVAIVGLTASVWDLRTRRIPNLLTFGATFVGIVFHTAIADWLGLGYSVAGWALGVALFFPLFMLRGMGAGDVKLLGAFGAWLGRLGIVRAAVAAALIGAGIALAVVVSRCRLRQLCT